MNGYCQINWNSKHAIGIWGDIGVFQKIDAYPLYRGLDFQTFPFKYICRSSSTTEWNLNIFSDKRAECLKSDFLQLSLCGPEIQQACIFLPIPMKGFENPGLFSW